MLVPLRLCYCGHPLHAELPLKLGARRVPHRFREQCSAASQTPESAHVSPKRTLRCLGNERQTS